MKQFDVLIKNRLTECEVLIYTIPYRDELNLRNQTVLQCRIDYYTLIKMISGRHGTVPMAYLSQMLATVAERVAAQSIINSDVQLKSQAFWTPKDTMPLVLVPKLQDLLYRRYIDVNNKILLAAKLDRYEISFPMGRESSRFLIDTRLVVDQYTLSLDYLKPSLLMSAHLSECASVPITPLQNAVNLAHEATAILRRYRYLSDMDEHLLSEFDDQLLTDLDYIDVEGDISLHLGRVNADTKLCSKLVESVIDFVSPVTNTVSSSQSVMITARRYRLISDLDNLTLVNLNDNQLPDLDYLVFNEEQGVNFL